MRDFRVPAAAPRPRRSVELCTDFARIMLGGNLTVFMIFLMNTNFRGAGDAVLAMRTLWLHLDARLVLGARTRSAVLFKRQRILRSRHSRIHSHHASA